MSVDLVMIDTATGASRPCSPTREVALSPIVFRSETEIETSTSDEIEDEKKTNGGC